MALRGRVDISASITNVFHLYEDAFCLSMWLLVASEDVSQLGSPSVWPMTHLHTHTHTRLKQCGHVCVKVLRTSWVTSTSAEPSACDQVTQDGWKRSGLRSCHAASESNWELMHNIF